MAMPGQDQISGRKDFWKRVIWLDDQRHRLFDGLYDPSSGVGHGARDNLVPVEDIQ